MKSNAAEVHEVSDEIKGSLTGSIDEHSSAMQLDGDTGGINIKSSGDNKRSTLVKNLLGKAQTSTRRTATKRSASLPPISRLPPVACFGDSNPRTSHLPLVLWVRTRESARESLPNVTVRIKNAKKFGESLTGLAEEKGDVGDSSWDNLLSLHPTILEINNMHNPLGSLVKYMREEKDEGKVSNFFSKMLYISLHACDIKVEDLIYVLNQIGELTALSYAHMTFGWEDWEFAKTALERVRIRALDISGGGGFIENVLGGLTVELLKFTGAPGVTAQEIVKTQSIFNTVRTLVISHLSYKQGKEVEEVLDVLPKKFPQLSSLILHWNIVDPILVFGDKEKEIVAKLVEVYNELHLEVLSLIVYNPFGKSKLGVDEVARFMSDQGTDDVKVLEFASKEFIDPGELNYSVVMCGRSVQRRALIEMIVVEGQNSTPSLSELMPLLDTNTKLNQPSFSFEFGGFDGAAIRKAYAEKKTAMTAQY